MFRALSRLPGVASGDVSAGFHVRGAEVDQLYASLDGHRLQEPFHMKDFDSALSIFDAQLVQSVDLLAGGFGAEYGGRLGSVLQMQSAAPRTDHVSLAGTLGILGVRAQAHGGLSNGRGGWLATARRGYLNTVIRLGGGPDSLSPSFTDALLKVDCQLSDRHRWSARILRADDGLKLGVDEIDLRSAYASTYLWSTLDSWLSPAVNVRTMVSTDVLRDVEIDPAVAADHVLRRPTEGRARGVELSARRVSARGLSTSASFTRTSITDEVNGIRVPRTHDQTNALLMDASMQPGGASWRVRLAFQVRSGWPDAPVSSLMRSICSARRMCADTASRGQCETACWW